MTNLSWLSAAQLSESMVGLADFRKEGGCSDNNCAFDSVRPFSANCDAAPAIRNVRLTCAP
jgi:hypothetical protein